MSEENTQVSQEQPVVSQTLDDVISEFNVQAPTETTSQNNVAEFTPAPAQQHIDAFDEVSLNQWATNTAENQNALQQQVQDLTSEISEFKQGQTKTKVEADIKSAVSKVTDKVVGLDPLMAEIYLEKRAAENPGFKTIWENRESNPKALNAALDAISGEIGDKFEFKADPQLAENHRAANQSQQSNNTPAASNHNNSYEERLASAGSEAERAKIWRDIKAGG